MCCSCNIYYYYNNYIIIANIDNNKDYEYNVRPFIHC